MGIPSKLLVNFVMYWPCVFWGGDYIRKHHTDIESNRSDHKSRNLQSANP